MGSNCCNNKSSELTELIKSQKKTLLAVLAINLVMFFVEFSYGLLSGSTALKADSLDMMGDALIYTFSIYVLDKGLKWKSYAALAKGAVMVIFGGYVLWDVGAKAMSDMLPHAHTMSLVAAVALVANLICLALLFKHRKDDVNLKSTWICSRNDIVSNSGVIIAGMMVTFTQSKWPDIIIGLIIAWVFFKSSIEVFKDAMKELHAKG